MDRLLPIPLIALALLTGPMLAAASAPPREGAPLLVVTAPWHDPEDVVTAAGGRVAAPLPAPLATVAAPGRPDLHARLRAAGAWLLLDGTAALRLCGVLS